MTPAQLDWITLCRTFADVNGYKLVYVNDDSCIVALPDGQSKLFHIDDMIETSGEHNDI